MLPPDFDFKPGVRLRWKGATPSAIATLEVVRQGGEQIAFQVLEQPFDGIFSSQFHIHVSSALQFCEEINGSSL
jgi:hypothetical protein